MSIIEIIIIAISLAMDAFAVAICKGVVIKKLNLKSIIIVGLYFGLFQAVMPIIGYLVGSSFYSKIESIDHYIILSILVLIGLIMIKESKDDEDVDSSLNYKNMTMLSIATSIDAMSVGITFSLLKVSIILACIIIGLITFILSMIGVKIGNIFGKKYKGFSCIIGGVLLILLGIKIFLEHLGIIFF